MRLRTIRGNVDNVLGVSRVSSDGFGRAARNLVRIAAFAVSLSTLILVRGNAPVWVALAAVSVSLGLLYLIDRKSGSLGLWAVYFSGFVLFALLRTTADETGIPVKASYVVDAERYLFGGALPQNWLQARLYRPGSTSPLDVLVVGVILSYFIAPHLVGLVLWRRKPTEFSRYCTAVLLTVYAGLAVSFVLPTAPPWLASRYTDAPEIQRLSSNVLGWNPENLASGSAAPGSNPFAAMPSLHFALTTLIVIALWRHRFLRLLALLYAAAMAFALVYGGEHYVVDELAGAATAGLAWMAATRGRLPRATRVPAASGAVSSVAPASSAD